jgi:hypothetical protein
MLGFKLKEVEEVLFNQVTLIDLLILFSLGGILIYLITYYVAFNKGYYQKERERSGKAL